MIFIQIDQVRYGEIQVIAVWHIALCVQLKGYDLLKLDQVVYRLRWYSHINDIKINSMERKPMNSKVIVLKNGKVVDSESMRVVIADVVISAGVITQVGDASSCDADVVIDCTGKIVTAGFIDTHVHIESSMVLPKSFEESVLPHGTTTVIADPHEVVNVAGAAGLRLFLDETDKAPSVFSQ